MALAGCTWEMFKDDKEAVDAANELIGQNREKYPDIDGSKDVASKVKPDLLSKFEYRHEGGFH